MDSAEILQLLSLQAERLKLKAAELQSISKGEIVVHDLPTSHGKEMAGFGAMVVEAEPNDFVRAFRTLSVFKQSKNVIACGLFESDLAPADLAGLKIKDKDLLELMRAQVNDSGIKLSGADISRIRTVAGPNPQFSNSLIGKLTDEYKQILLEKIKSYATLGGESLGAYADRGESVDAHDSILRMLRYQTSYAKYDEQFYTLLADHPRAHDERAESFYYWAVQKFSQLKPVITLVHVMIFREGGRVIIASKQIYSSHYTEAGLGIAELIPLTDRQGKVHTLTAYTIRLQVDMLGGATGFLKKRMAQPRMLETLKESLTGLRRDLETTPTVVSK